MDIWRQLEERIAAWAAAQEGIRAAVVVGSRARQDHPADEWSDLDIMLYLREPDAYLGRTDWLDGIGTVWATFLSRTAGGDPERLVLFAGGRQVDLVFCPARYLDGMVQFEGLRGIFARGARILLDRDGTAGRVLQLAACPHAPVPPTPEQFAETQSMFWLGAWYQARQIARGELWPARTVDARLKDALLRVIELHARLTRGAACDTWHAGRFLHEWADPDVIAELPATFGGLGQAEAWDAIVASMALFRRLATECARHLGYPDPRGIAERVSALVLALRARRVSEHREEETAARW